MRIQSKIKRSKNTGQTLVEFALILPVLFLLMFAIIEAGRYLFLKNGVTNAAREVARRAVVTNPLDAASVVAIKTDMMSGTGINLDYIEIIPEITPPTSGTAITVTVRKRFSNVVPRILPLFTSLTSIRATATMRHE